MNPQVVGLLLQGHPQKKTTPQKFEETAIQFLLGSTPNLHYINSNSFAGALNPFKGPTRYRNSHISVPVYIYIYGYIYTHIYIPLSGVL